MSGKIDFETAMWNRIKQHAEASGYSSTEEFVLHAVEKEMARTGPDTADPKKIKGIGYIDAGLDI